MFAKAELSKITIKGAELKTPIEISDPGTLAKFNVWSGPGTSSFPEDADRFVVQWSLVAAERPKGLQRYQVSFYAKFPNEKLVYVVLYEYDPAAQRGYIYLPGRGEEWYGLNMGTIARGVEGHWYRASAGWDAVARPLIASAVTAGRRTGDEDKSQAPARAPQAECTFSDGGTITFGRKASGGSESGDDAWRAGDYEATAFRVSERMLIPPLDSPTEIPSGSYTLY